MNKLPLARTEDLVTQALDKEMLIYDLTSNKYFCLNETSALVYQACGSNSTFEELKRKHRFTDDLICLTLDKLISNDLLERNADYKSTLANLSRREAIRKVGLASMIALPVISSLVAPSAAQAASALNCTPQNSCACIYASDNTTSTSCTGASIVFGSCGDAGCVCNSDANGPCTAPNNGNKLCIGSCN